MLQYSAIHATTWSMSYDIMNMFFLVYLPSFSHVIPHYFFILYLITAIIILQLIVCTLVLDTAFVVHCILATICHTYSISIGISL